MADIVYYEHAVALDIQLALSLPKTHPLKYVSQVLLENDKGLVLGVVIVAYAAVAQDLAIHLATESYTHCGPFVA